VIVQPPETRRGGVGVGVKQCDGMPHCSWARRRGVPAQTRRRGEEGHLGSNAAACGQPEGRLLAPWPAFGGLLHVRRAPPSTWSSSQRGRSDAGAGRGPASAKTPAPPPAPAQPGPCATHKAAVLGPARPRWAVLDGASPDTATGAPGACQSPPGSPMGIACTRADRMHPPKGHSCACIDERPRAPDGPKRRLDLRTLPCTTTAATRMPLHRAAQSTMPGGSKET
jgi:hypothetical protein